MQKAELKKKIFEISTIKSEIIEYLKMSECPLVLWGAMKFASVTKRLLENNNIKIDFVAVGEEYWKPNQKFYEFDVLPLENILQNNKKTNIVIAFQSEKYRETILSESHSIIFLERAFSWVFDSEFIYSNYGLLINLYYALQDDLSQGILLAFMCAKNSINSKELVVFNVLGEEQYFPNFLSLSDNEIFVDCGAYTGDTIEIFIDKVNGKFNKIFAFEPDTSNIKKCREMIDMLKVNDVVLIEKGVWKNSDTLYFDTISNPCFTVNQHGNEKLKVDSIDNVCGNEKVSFIKMDVEGSELEALKGAEKTIIRNKPKLAISVYHKKEDLITIPQYILSLNPEYKLYLRHYGSFTFELILYAV